jgi:hypothetical protein
MIARSLLLSFSLTMAMLLSFPSTAWSCTAGPSTSSELTENNAPECLLIKGKDDQYGINPFIQVTNNCTETSIIACVVEGEYSSVCEKTLEVAPGESKEFRFPFNSQINRGTQETPKFTLSFQLGSQSGQITIYQVTSGDTCNLNTGNRTPFVECSLSQAPGMPTQTPWWVLSSLAGAVALIGMRRSRLRDRMDCWKERRFFSSTGYHYS